MDAKVWAQEFMKTFKAHAGEPPAWLDEDLMLGWFANAIMCGWDHAHWKLDPQQEHKGED